MLYNSLKGSSSIAVCATWRHTGLCSYTGGLIIIMIIIIVVVIIIISYWLLLLVLLLLVLFIYIYIYVYLHIRIHVYPPSTNLEVTSWKIKRANENILRTALAPREWTRFNIEFGGGGKVSGRFTAKAVCQQHRYSLEADKVWDLRHAGRPRRVFLSETADTVMMSLYPFVRWPITHNVGKCTC